MDCHQFEEQLNDRLDRRLSPSSSALIEHTRNCPPCFQMLKGAIVLQKGIGIWRSQPLPVIDIVDRVLAQPVPNETDAYETDSASVYSATQSAPIDFSSIDNPGNGTGPTSCADFLICRAERSADENPERVRSRKALVGDVTLLVVRDGKRPVSAPRPATSRLNAGSASWLALFASLAGMWFVLARPAVHSVPLPGKSALNSGLIGSNAPDTASLATNSANNRLVQTDDRTHEKTGGPESVIEDVPQSPSDLAHMIASASGAYTRIAIETSAAADDFRLLLPTRLPFISTNSSDDVPNSTLPTGQNSRGMKQHESETEAIPLQDTMHEALEFFWKAVPGVPHAST